MSDILLAKPKLPPDWIDVSVGEPYVVREALFETFDVKGWQIPEVEHGWEYPPSNGYAPLVDALQYKHQAPVVVTNGAKQALAATFYAIKKMGLNTMGMKLPYWALIPPLATMYGLQPVTHSLESILPDEPSYFDSYLCLAPNNPDGHCPSPEELKRVNTFLKSKNIPLIHDAVYYTYSYLPRSVPLTTIGDVQIYSLSKMLGLSSLRVGYAVCPNPEFYNLIKGYVEATTVGVSLPSQMFAFDLLNQMRGYPTKVEKFENISFEALQKSKKIIKQVDPEILQVSTILEELPGMFGWFHTGPKFNPEKAKINFISGDLFGMPGMVRMNLAFGENRMLEIVNRLNSCKE
jgi:aspartate/methionine/tyrosine aminotransferase